MRRLPKLMGLADGELSVIAFRAAVLAQEGRQPIDGVCIGGIDQRPPLALDGNQAGLFQLIKMERQCRAGQFQQLSDASGGEAVRPVLDQGTENVQAGVLGQCRELGDGEVVFHGCSESVAQCGAAVNWTRRQPLRAYLAFGLVSNGPRMHLGHPADDSRERAPQAEDRS